jgi:hypothetical protein
MPRTSRKPKRAPGRKCNEEHKVREYNAVCAVYLRRIPLNQVEQRFPGVSQVNIRMKVDLMPPNLTDTHTSYALSRALHQVNSLAGEALYTNHELKDATRRHYLKPSHPEHMTFAQASKEYSISETTLKRATKIQKQALIDHIEYKQLSYQAMIETTLFHSHADDTLQVKFRLTPPELDAEKIAVNEAARTAELALRDPDTIERVNSALTFPRRGRKPYFEPILEAVLFATNGLASNAGVGKEMGAVRADAQNLAVAIAPDAATEQEEQRLKSASCGRHWQQGALGRTEAHGLVPALGAYKASYLSTGNICLRFECFVSKIYLLDGTCSTAQPLIVDVYLSLQRCMLSNSC